MQWQVKQRHMDVSGMIKQHNAKTDLLDVHFDLRILRKCKW